MDARARTVVRRSIFEFSLAYLLPRAMAASFKAANERTSAFPTIYMVDKPSGIVVPVARIVSGHFDIRPTVVDAICPSRGTENEIIPSGDAM